MSRPHAGRTRAAVVLRRLRQAASWLLPLAAFVVILLVLRGAGVPLSVPGVIVVLVLLGVVRVLVGRARRRRSRRPVTDRTRSR